MIEWFLVQLGIRCKWELVRRFGDDKAIATITCHYQDKPKVLGIVREKMSHGWKLVKGEFPEEYDE